MFFKFVFLFPICAIVLFLAGTNLNPKPLIFDIQNCNSLNLTGLTSNFDLKMAAILNGEADVILLSDIRLISPKEGQLVPEN
jgi:hypothetical protein